MSKIKAGKQVFKWTSTSWLLMCVGIKNSVRFFFSCFLCKQSRLHKLCSPKQINSLEIKLSTLIYGLHPTWLLTVWDIPFSQKRKLLSQKILNIVNCQSKYGAMRGGILLSIFLNFVAKLNMNKHQSEVMEISINHATIKLRFNVILVSNDSSNSILQFDASLYEILDYCWA